MPSGIHSTSAAKVERLFISISLSTKRHSVKLRQTNQYEIDAYKFIKIVLNENVLLIQQ